MHIGERSSTYVFAAITLFLAALAGLIIPLASGGASRDADAAWAPPTPTPTRLMATAAATRTPRPTFTVQATPTRQAPATMTAATPTAESTATPDATVPPAPTETMTPATVSDLPTARIAGDAVNLRAGPGTSFGILATASTGDTFAITGQSTNGAPAAGSGIRKWWRVCCVAGGPAWVADDFIEIIGDTGSVPIAQ